MGEEAQAGSAEQKGELPTPSSWIEGQEPPLPTTPQRGSERQQPVSFQAIVPGLRGNKSPGEACGRRARRARPGR